MKFFTFFNLLALGTPLSCQFDQLHTAELCTGNDEGTNIDHMPK